jgi:hypothetical protein
MYEFFQIKFETTKAKSNYKKPLRRKCNSENQKLSYL